MISIVRSHMAFKYKCIHDCTTIEIKNFIASASDKTPLTNPLILKFVGGG